MVAKSLPAHSPELLAALEKLTGCEANTVRRIVVDVQAGQIPTVYIEQFGDAEKLSDVILAMTEIQIVRPGAPTGDATTERI